MTLSTLHKPEYCKLAALFVLLISFPRLAVAQTTGTIDRQAAISSEYARLSQARTAADSLPIVYNLFDLSLGQQRVHMADTLYGVACRAHDTAAYLDAIRHRANLHLRDNALLGALKHETERLEPSDDLTETRLFLDMLILRNEINSITDEEESRAQLAHRMSEFSGTSMEDPAAKTLQLYALCIFTEKATHGELLAVLLDMLDQHIRSMDLPNGVISRHFYTRAANALSHNDDYARVLDIDRRMLAVMDTLCAEYHAAGRIYRNYETNRYNCYRRMLGAYDLLTPDQVEEYYGEISSLARRNPQIAADIANNPRAKVFYLMARRRYSEAIPLLRQCIGIPANEPYRRQLLEALVKASGETGDEESQLQASIQLNNLLDRSMQLRKQDNVRELQLFADINELTEQKNRLEIRQRVDAERARRYTIIISSVAVLLLLISLILLSHQFRKVRKLAIDLRQTNEKLRQERDNLRHTQQELTVARDNAAAAERMKTEFVNTMSHEVSSPINAIAEYSRLIVDCMPPEKAQYLERFARTIEFNSQLVLSLVKDVLECAALDDNGISVERRPVSAYSLCTVAIDTVFENGKSCKDGLKVVFNPEKQPDVCVLTDSYRAVQVLTNLLSNAEKFTDKGTVSLSFEPDDEKNVVNFSVTDTGAGVPDGMEEIIFHQFRKADHSTSGVGLGLYIARRIARLLGGNISLDRNYHRGARFVFTLPLAT